MTRPTTDRRGLIAALQDELPDALRKLQQGAIAPVDLPQAAIGPGMAVFSRYAKVIENDGTAMTVRSALARINEILDQVLNEQEGDFDAADPLRDRLVSPHGYATGTFGDRRRSRARPQHGGRDAGPRRDPHERRRQGDAAVAVEAAGGLRRPRRRPRRRVGGAAPPHRVPWSATGYRSAGAFLASAQSAPDGAIDTELVKELAFLLFSIAEKNGWTQDALAFNTVATAWPDVVQAARSTQTGTGEQSTFDFEED